MKSRWIARVAAFPAALMIALGSLSLAADGPVFQARVLEEFDAAEARQGLAIDDGYFYAVSNFAITRHERRTGKQAGEWRGRSAGDPLIHLDSLVAHEGKLYASHSNYPEWPMTSSVEIWDAKTMEHIGTHSFGIYRGSFTWLDRHDGSWWGAFANYDKVQDGQAAAYGETDRTQVVKMNDEFAVVESWIIPREILDRFRPMSNSGGSWGPDGFLYLTGHDLGEAYVMRLPRAGSVLEWVATVQVPVMEGQGIAWDRSGDARHLWAIVKKDRKVLKIEMPPIELPAPM